MHAFLDMKKALTSTLCLCDITVGIDIQGDVQTQREYCKYDVMVDQLASLLISTTHDVPVSLDRCHYVYSNSTKTCYLCPFTGTTLYYITQRPHSKKHISIDRETYVYELHQYVYDDTTTHHDQK